MEDILRPFKDAIEKLYQDHEKSKEAINNGNKELSGIIDYAGQELPEKLSGQKSDVERGAQALLATAAVQTRTIISGGGGSSSSAASLTFRGRTESFSANITKNIIFSSPMGATFSLSSLRVLDTSGMAVMDFAISNLTASGFDFLCPVDGTLTYLSVEDV